MATSTDAPIPPLKDLASSDPKLRRASLQAITTYLATPSRSPLTHTQCLQLWRGLTVALLMHDSKNAVSVQSLADTLADQFHVLAERERTAAAATDDSSEFTVFSQAFWETISRDWLTIDSHRINKILLLIRLVIRQLFRIVLEDEPHNPDSSTLLDRQLTIITALPLSPRERKVPDGLRYHVLDVWLDELERGVGEAKQTRCDEAHLAQTATRLMRPVAQMAKEGLSKGVRGRAKEVLAQAEGKGFTTENY